MRNYEAVYGEAAGRRPKKYYYILDNDTFQLVLLPTKYLKYKVDVERSPNTVKRFALSLSYYLQYLSETELELAEVSRLGFEEQSKHFVQFLYWLKEGRHVDTKRIGNTRNATCNAYLRDVFGFFLYLANNEYCKPLRVLSYDQITVPNAVGVKRTIRSNSFKGYLKEEERNVRAAEEAEFIEVLHACTNTRDQLLLLMLAETGFRIGELLGVDYTRDIDYENQTVKVYFRNDNENDARAKNAEERKARLSHDTFEFLLCIGPRGTRVNKIVEELAGEKIDIVKYSDDPHEFVAEALSPAKVVAVEIESEDPKVCKVSVPESQLSLAIGNKGQNVRLAAKLTGWKIDIHPESGFFGE